ncbi:MAG: alpha/beta hydrolase [Candidatus Woesearchaeota archaeon]
MIRIGPRKIPVETLSSGSSNGTVVIVPHWTGSMDDSVYPTMVSRLADKYEVIRCSLYGRGADNGSLRDGSISDDVEDLQQVIALANNSRVVIAAESLGATISVQATSVASGYVFLNPAWGGINSNPSFIKMLHRAQRTGRFFGHDIGASMIQEFLDYNAHLDLTRLEGVLYVVAGSNDTVTSQQTQRSVLKNVRNSGRINVIDSSKHLLTGQAAEDAVDFLTASIDEVFQNTYIPHR